MSLPPKRMRPADAGTSPETGRPSVLLPAPFGPEDGQRTARWYRQRDPEESLRGPVADLEVLHDQAAAVARLTAVRSRWPRFIGPS